MQKRHRLLAQLNRRKAHLVFLQETHLVDAEIVKLKKKWRGQFFSPSYSAFARGATIWVRNGVPFKPIEQRKYINGRYVLVKGSLDGEMVVIGSIYAPNSEQDTFLETLNTILVDWEQYPWIVGGDFNMVLDVTLDRSHRPLQNTSSRKLADALKEWHRVGALEMHGDCSTQIVGNTPFSHIHIVYTLE